MTADLSGLKTESRSFCELEEPTRAHQGETLVAVDINVRVFVVVRQVQIRQPFDADVVAGGLEREHSFSRLVRNSAF